jgi:hypothetical protein
LGIFSRAANAAVLAAALASSDMVVCIHGKEARIYDLGSLQKKS